MNPEKRNQKQTVIDVFNRRADDRIERKQTEKQLLQLIEQKNTQISVLDHVNTRLGAELVLLQRKLGIDHGAILKEMQDIKEISAAFHYETEQLEYLDALLTAYDQNNLVQKKIIANLYSSLEDAEKKTQNLVKDNQFLLEELQDKTKQILQIYSKGFVDDNLTSAYSKLQRETEIELMENIRGENEYLLQNYRSVEDKFQKREQQLKDLKKKSDHYFELYKKQSQDLKQALIRVDDLIKIKDVLEKKIDEVTQENIDLETTRQQLETKLNRIENEGKELRNQFHLQKTLKHEQLERVDQELLSLKMEHQASQKREREYFNKNMLLEKDLQNQKQDVKIIRRELEKTKADFEQTLKMCEAYETKVNIYAKKEVVMRETVQDCKQKLESALLERDKAILKEKQLEKVIESIKQRNRDQIQTFKSTFEKVIYEQNEKIKVLEEDKDDSNSIFYQNECSLKHQIDKLKRDNQLLKEENIRHAENVKTNSGSQIINKLRDLEQKNESLSRVVNQKQRAYREDVEHKDEIIRNLETQNRELGRQADRERATARQAVNERTQYKSKISVLQKQKECLEDEITKLKRVAESKAYANTEQKQSRIRQLQQKLSQAIKREKALKQNTIDLLQKHDEAQEQYQLECQNKIITLESQIKKLRKRAEKDKK